ncbi:hypothetical protein BN11_560007 [Nostocoides australiense Ben110]|uniref:NUDIX hydrolase n=1 Tax=Nostocoides australiense Ben110 TaxID=1193182 RepID=W6K272_9MICO|nr:hypothetical protein [Tetrasphaera australiensis]CCH75211.1 hypothetical protein BN11_560007 [Tetrasphaera australiensis Ben110]
MPAPLGDRSCTYVSGDREPIDGENTAVAWFDLDALPPLRASSHERIARAVAFDGAP